ncbi:vWA domain-containing protein [Streptomyces sp. IBSBF 2435]|uniref:vWA domain-containing protein n=1 Tax=Streptomyces sp. IBSBF 2435 TaxID=2903531 RepID=UPI002FDBBA2B
MPEPLSLIAERKPVARMTVGPTRATSPYLAVVYATASGEVACFDGRPMTPSQQVFSKYRSRYEVDMRDHSRTVRLASNPMVARDKVHEFEVTVSFSFRINGWTGAEQWVRGGLPDVLPVVYGYINGLFHGAGQGYDIEDSFGLQHDLGKLCASPVVLTQGVLVHSCQVAVRPDAKSRLYLERLLEADRRLALGEAEHEPAVSETRHGIEIEAIQQSASLAARRRESDALGDALDTAEGLIRHYLVTHPDDAATAVEMRRQLEATRAESAELQATRGLALFNTMVEKGLIQSGDLNAMRDQVVGQVQRATGTGISALAPSAVPWDAPLTLGAAPGAAPAAPAPGPVPPPAATSPAGPAGPAGPSGLYEPTVVVPERQPPAPAAFAATALIYLVLDESVAPGALDEFNRGLGALHDALSGAPAVSATLRVCVLGMAADTVVRLEPSTVTPGTRTPILTRRPGLSYEQAFRTLRLLLPQDVALAKAEHPAVLRPMVFFVSGGVPDEGAGWREAHRELVDRAAHPTAPQIIACGLGRAEPLAVGRIATRPEFAHLAAPHTDAASAAHSCAAFLRDCVAGYGQRLAAGSSEFTLIGPDGFRPAADAI